MCSADELKIITSKVSELSKETFGSLLENVILYGSYARGEQDSESDIDIMILADVDAEKLSDYKKNFIILSSELGLEYDIVITITLKDCRTFREYYNAMPFYRNVIKEGIKIA